MSGTDKLWKNWKDNFTKLLAMFPLIIAMIYVGRVFAWILAQQTKDPGLLNFMGVMVAYFGPYFMIFKAYKWGGSMMSMAGEGINKGVNKMAERPRKLLEERAKQHKEGKAITAADRLSRWQSLSRREKLGSMVRGDKFRSGQWDPTMRTSGILRHERQVKTAKFLAAGPKHNEELIEAETGALQAYLRGNVDRSDHDKVRKAGIAGEDLIYKPGDETSGILLSNGKRGSYYGSKLSSAQRQAVLDRGVVHGHMRSIEEYLDKAMKGSPEDRAAAVAFLDRNAQTLGKEMPHLLKGLTIAARSKPDAIAGMRQEAIESTIAKLQEKMNDTSPGVSDDDRQAAAENLSIFLQNYAAAAADPRLSSQLDPGGAKVVKAAVDSLGEQLQDINIDDDDARVAKYHLAPVQGLASSIPPTYKAMFDDPAVKAALGQISTLITSEGIISTKAASASSGNIQVTASPTEIKIQHARTAKAILPPPATISVPGPGLEAFKLQIGSDAAVRQVLAQNIAYDTADSPQYKQALEEYRKGLQDIFTDPASTPEQAEKARSQWNAMAEEIQQATRRRIDETAAAAAARGHDVASVRTAAGTRLNPQILGYEATAPAPPAGEPDLRKF